MQSISNTTTQTTIRGRSTEAGQGFRRPCQDSGYYEVAHLDLTNGQENSIFQATGSNRKASKDLHTGASRCESTPTIPGAARYVGSTRSAGRDKNAEIRGALRSQDPILHHD